MRTSSFRFRSSAAALAACAALLVLVAAWSPSATADDGDLSRLGNQRLAAWGLVDVTAAPFHADPTGQRDSTDAIQQAILFARDHQMVCYFPPGEYRVSDTLECEQFRPLTRDGRRRKGTRDYPCVLVGSLSGGPRPRIVLAPNSPGFSDPSHPKYVIHFWSPGNGVEAPLDQPQPNISMNQMLVGIDVVIGPGNPGAVGVRHRAAQGSAVQDCTIDARYGYCGLEGGAGSGGSHANVTVIGGRIGVDLRETQPASTIVGFTLLDQTETALLVSGRQTVTAVGLRIRKSSPGPAVVTRKKWGAHHGQLCLVDSVLELVGVDDGTAIEAESSLYLNNVYVRGASTLVRAAGHEPLRVDPAEWTHVKEYACGIPERFRSRKYGNRSFLYPAPIYVDGKRWPQDTLVDVEQGSQPPPADLQARHVWSRNFPSWQTPGAVNVKEPPYNAAGDGTTDDFAALQRAVDENEVVFLPKGRYALSRTLRLRPNTKLVGVHRCYTWLVPLDRPGGDFHNPAAPQPVVQTANAADAQTVLAFLGIRTLRQSTAAYCLRWQSGRRSVFRAVNTVFDLKAPPQGPARKLPPERWKGLSNGPVVRVDGNGGGRWYNFHQESSRGHAPNHRQLLVEGTHEPLHFYQCNPEHARSDANMEVRSARFVSIYGLKGEYYQPILWIRDSDHVRLFGYGGNAAAAEGHALFVVERTPNFLLANLVDSPRLPRGLPETFFAGDGVEPTKWWMVTERWDVDGRTTEIHTRPLERPVLYRRGHPRAR